MTGTDLKKSKDDQFSRLSCPFLLIFSAASQPRQEPPAGASPAPAERNSCSPPPPDNIPSSVRCGLFSPPAVSLGFGSIYSIRSDFSAERLDSAGLSLTRPFQKERAVHGASPCERQPRPVFCGQARSVSVCLDSARAVPRRFLPAQSPEPEAQSLFGAYVKEPGRPESSRRPDQQPHPGTKSRWQPLGRPPHSTAPFPLLSAVAFAKADSRFPMQTVSIVHPPPNPSTPGFNSFPNLGLTQRRAGDNVAP